MANTTNSGLTKKMLAMGGREWFVRAGDHRVYLGERIKRLVCENIGLCVRRHDNGRSIGRISSATMVGEEISVGRACAILRELDGAFYDVTNNKFRCAGEHINNLDSALRKLLEAIPT